MLSSLTVRSKSVVIPALACVGICLAASDIAVRKTVAPAIEERRLIIRSGTLFTKDGVPINLSGFDSEIQSDKSSQPGVPIGPKEIRGVIVRSGSAFVRAKDLGKMLESHLNNDKITGLAVETAGTEIKISGHLKKAIPVHFEIKGPISVTESGLLDLHESSMKVDKLPMKALSQMLGMDPAHVIGNSAGKVLQANKEDILFDPALLWGMSVRGKLTQAKVANGGLVLVYGGPRRGAQKSMTTPGSTLKR